MSLAITLYRISIRKTVNLPVRPIAIYLKNGKVKGRVFFHVCFCSELLKIYSRQYFRSVAIPHEKVLTQKK